MSVEGISGGTAEGEGGKVVIKTDAGKVFCILNKSDLKQALLGETRIFSPAHVIMRSNLVALVKGDKKLTFYWHELLDLVQN